MSPNGQHQRDRRPDAGGWVLCGDNPDEDLHFSAHYLRATCRSRVPHTLARYACDDVVALYEQLNERYWAPREQVTAAARDLIGDVLADPRMMWALLEEISVRCQSMLLALEGVDPPSATRDELVAAYSRHYQAQFNLYQVARVPEALDRG